MNTPKFTLEPYKGMRSRHVCPKCNKKEFTRYINIETGQYINREVGRCNREINCGYHYTPRQYFEDNNLEYDPQPQFKPHHPPPPRPTSFVPNEIMEKSLQGYSQNNFVQYLISLFGKNTTNELIKRYRIGTSKHWPGSTVFWQIDISGRVRTGKIMLYDETGHRVKNRINWVHSVLMNDFNLKQCFFGEHLLKDNPGPIAIAESEKTAIIASVFLPKFVWLATGGLHNLKESKFKPLAGRKVVLYPDLNVFEKWKQKADALADIARIGISEILEKNATDEERKKGLDLADYLIQMTPPAPPAKESESSYQTIGEIFDMMKERNPEKLPANFFGANTGKWKTKILDPVYRFN